MIVWVASFPRSGNTFFRILLHRLYQVPTYVVYDVDGVADQIGTDLMDFRPRPGTFDQLRTSSEVFFIKTHRQRSDPLVSERDRAICLVRDGRDCVVSWARLRTAHHVDQPDYETLFAAEARAIITRQSGGTAHWGQNVLSWRQSTAPDPIWIRYDDLIVDPLDTVRAAVAATDNAERHHDAAAGLPALAPRARRRPSGATRLRLHRSHCHRLVRRVTWSP
ncbi:sulfotransferase domain-containing protein [Phytoactinopolyspora halotolerans]|uniref:Sulfotransferase domain-containing protein n=1 Tax=Phytoactinopolyspora halotolerans TaxID=1981512 RepID=A0A6L9SIM9_9ACTN|nr:sulfotransferase domain-containing protein [Phytoactinopolyspora halotolerans]NEE04538.1 sulfotransferase domain-containing protein [Phytoactinopolyspora halotolerans]